MTDARHEEDMLAAEFALGVLEGPERAEAEARIERDPGFVAEVEEWRVRLAPMLAAAGESPPDHVWHGINARLAANDDAPASGAAEKALRRWRAIGIGASALAASLALVLVVRTPAEQALPTQPPPIAAAAAPTPMVATLQAEDGTSTIVTISMAGPDRLMITPVRMPEDRRVPELWIIPEDGKPRSLGVMPAGGPSSMAVAAGHKPHLHQGATFAISREPQGGSPTGAPTGPVIASGKISTI
jgi:anti-sigma-K factor RskA